MEAILFVRDLVTGKFREIPYIIGPQGKDGKSAYQLAVEGGFEGTVEEWLESLKYRGANGGIYFGPGEMPEGYREQIVPEQEKEINVEMISTEERESIIQEILETVVGDVYGVCDANNNVTLSANLPAGTYVFKLEMADGSVLEIGNAVVRA